MQSVSSWAAIWPPITLGILASIAAREKADIRLVDCNVEDVDVDGLLKDIGNYQPEDVVINTAFPTIETDMQLARRAAFHILKEEADI